MPIDEARLLPRFRTPTWRTPEPLLESDRIRDWRPGDHHNHKPTNPIITWSAEDLRGIPIVGRGSPGAQPGTNPEAEAIRKDRAA